MTLAETIQKNYIYSSVSTQVVHYGNLTKTKVQNFTVDQQKRIADLLNKVVQNKEKIVKMSKDLPVAKNIDEATDSIVTHLENQLSQVNYLYNQQKFVPSDVCETKKSYSKRLQALAIGLNNLIRLIIQDQLLKVQNLNMAKNLAKLYQSILVNPKVREILIFATIAKEFLTDLVSNRVIKPSITYIDNKYSKLKDTTTITITNLKSKLFEQYVPLVKEKYSHLKNASIEFYNDKVTIKFAQEYYEQNKSAVQKELKEVYDNFRTYQSSIKSRYENVYQSAFESYRSKRQVKLNQYETGVMSF